MSKKATLCIAVLIAWSSSAQARPNGLALSLERGFGFTSASTTVETDTITTTSSTTHFGLGLNPGQIASDSGAPMGFTLARVGIDYLTRGGLTLGSGVGYATVSGELEQESPGGAGSISSESSGSMLLLAPRVGYTLMFASEVGLWPRGGITYTSISAESEELGAPVEASIGQFAVTLEAPLIIVPSSSFGVLIAPTFDYVLSHSTESDGTELDHEVSGSAFGIQFGLMGIL